MIKLQTICLFAGLAGNIFFVAAAREVRADQVTINALKDNSLYESNVGDLTDGAGSWFFAGRTFQPAGTALRRGVIQFDIVANVPAGATITSVTLKLRMTKSNGSTSYPMSLRRLLASWGEGTSISFGNEGAGGPSDGETPFPSPDSVTWIHRSYNSVFWTNPGGDFSATTSASASVGGVASYTWGSTSGMIADVQSWLDTPANNFGWVLLGNETTPGSAKRFAARENSTASSRPLLTVQYTPPVLCPGPADGDMDGNAIIDGNDIQSFVNLILGTPTQSQLCHGDFDADHTLDVDDINGFVAALIVP